MTRPPPILPHLVEVLCQALPAWRGRAGVPELADGACLSQARSCTRIRSTIGKKPWANRAAMPCRGPNFDPDASRKKHSLGPNALGLASLGCAARTRQPACRQAEVARLLLAPHPRGHPWASTCATIHVGGRSSPDQWADLRSCEVRYACLSWPPAFRLRCSSSAMYGTYIALDPAKKSSQGGRKGPRADKVQGGRTAGLVCGHVCVSLRRFLRLGLPGIGPAERALARLGCGH